MINKRQALNILRIMAGFSVLLSTSPASAYDEADLEEFWNSGKHCTYCDLSDVDLSGADLDFAFLISTNLSNANLSDATLKWANLSEADLSGADFSGANLRNAELNGADFTGATYDEDTQFPDDFDLVISGLVFVASSDSDDIFDIVADDSEDTVIVPEPTSFFALLSLGGLAVASLKRKYSS